MGERKDRCAVRTSAVLFFVILASTFQGTALASAPKHFRHLTVAHPHHVAIRVAPADEYFGRLKMSILGIRNSLRDLSLRLSYAPDKSEDVLGSAAMVEDALHDWEHKYPADPWLPKSVYQLASLYASVPTPNGHDKAAHALRWLLTRYGRTPYGAQARTQLVPHVGLR